MSEGGLVQLRRRPTAAGEGVVAPGSASGATTPSGEASARVYIETYGCQMNVADTEMALGLLAGAGYTRTDDPASADVILLNTCAVREKAEERVFSRASALALEKRRRPVVLGITGCMAEHLKDAIRERAPHVDLVLGPDAYRRLPERVAEARRGEKVQDTALDRFENYEGLDPVRGDAGLTGQITGHITIQRGCDKFCTFCIVPYTRGRERGTPPREVLRQAHAMVDAGYQEIQLLGQTVNSYQYEDVGFAELLRAVAAIPGLGRLRFTSPYPLDFSPAVIEAMASSPVICKHVHLPLQSASDSVLSRMRRGYTFEVFRRLVADLRQAMPGIAISTDFLVGFCDETDEEFAATAQALEEIRFDNAFLFAYSEREGTVAARKMPDTVPEDVKQRRLAQLIDAQKRVSGEIHAGLVGRIERVLVEAPSKRSPSEWLGRTDTFRSVIIPATPDLAAGHFVDVRIARANSATLFGEVVGRPRA